jgi:archaellum biogenesis ATPase FlaH
LNEILEACGDATKIIIIESLSTFLIYNHIDDLRNFIRNLVSKNDPNLKIFAITPEKNNKMIVEGLAPFFDKIITI